MIYVDRGMSAEYALEKYMPLVRQILSRAVSHAEDREDIEQQVALAILRRSASVRSEAMPAYVRGSCRNMVHGYYRARYREDTRRQRQVTPDDLCAPEEVFETLWRTERREALDLAIDRLPQRFRSVVMVHLYQGRNLKDVADLLGINHATARWRLHRAIQLMRQCIHPTGNGRLNHGRT